MPDCPIVPVWRLLATPEGGAYDPLAAMIGPLRCVPDMSPSLGASPKVNTLPSASATQ